MDWLEISVDTKGDPDTLCAVLESLDVSGLVIEDSAEFSALAAQDCPFWGDGESVPEETFSRVKFYLFNDAQGLERLQILSAEISSRGYCTDIKHVRDEDWENNWKEYYRSFPVGEKLIIVPDWEESPDTAGRIALRLDPGLIFGTGSHPTTRMCLELAEHYVPSAASVLDLGCGSGILFIAALLLGAGHAVGCDIDPKAPEVAALNAARNSIHSDRFNVRSEDASNLGSSLSPSESFDLIFINIVADVVISLLPAASSHVSDTGVVICSGILSERAPEVEAAARDAGLRIIKRYESDGWLCYALSRRKENAI
ncbi:MAG: 50S ribosomal protein L11 methyltransferase [Clostridiales bacterium]|nr:50S ribosomal protein L11 methyltransferase [Clostridiales bacterium]